MLNRRRLLAATLGLGLAPPAAAQQAGPVPPLNGVIVPPLYGQPPVRQAAPRKPVRQAAPRKPVRPRREALPICVERPGIGGSRLVCSRPLQAK